MSNKPNASVRSEVSVKLSQLIGLSLTNSHRAADLRVFHFGSSGPNDHSPSLKIALHIQCAWRLVGKWGIITGRTDLWEPVDEEAPFDENWDYDSDPNLQDVLFKTLFDERSPLVVAEVTADDFGGAAIVFGQDVILQVFPAGSRGEDWRMLTPDDDASHFIVSGGTIERD